MRYKIVAVDQLSKPFPLVLFGLANVVSLEDANGQLIKKYKEMAQLRIDADDAHAKIAGEPSLNADGRQCIFDEYRNVAEGEFDGLDERWSKIEPALKLHLARQKRRLAHFKVSCRAFGCDNPHPLGSAYFRRFGHGAAKGSSMPKSTGQAVAMQGTKRHSPQFFCGCHRWLKSQLSSENYARLSDPKYRVKVA